MGTAAWSKAMDTSLPCVSILLLLGTYVRPQWTAVQDSGMVEFIQGYPTTVTSGQHCSWANLQQRVKRVEVGNGFNIYFNYDTCPNGPDPHNLSCVRKGLRTDNLQIHPCCNGYSSTLPNCQRLVYGMQEPADYPENISQNSGNQRQSLNSINGTDNSYGACFFSGYVFHGQPLKVFPNHVGKLVNHKRNVRTIQECIEECRRKRLCGWFNWMDNTSTDMNLRNTCWLKKGRGNPNPTWKTGAFTGNRNASWQCTPWLWTYNKANGHDLFWYPVIM